MCQGQSLNQVALYLPRPVFTHGQLYVAMSRVTTPNGPKILDETFDMDGEDGVTNIVYKEMFKDVWTTEVSTTHLLYTFLIYPILFALTNYRNLHCILGRLNSLSERIHIIGIEVDKFFCYPNHIFKI